MFSQLELLAAEKRYSQALGQVQSVDQNVTITAEFPNVVDRYEIESAFGNLINLAAQYAY
jgi:hypothetical protein